MENRSRMGRWAKPTVFSIAGFVALGGTTWGAFHWPPEDSGQVAAWVQAIGSVAAIIATAVGVHWAHSLAAKAAAEAAATDEVRRLAAIASSIFHCRAETESLKRYCGYMMDVQEKVEGLTKHINMLQAINLLDIPDWRAAVAVGQALAMHSFLREKLMAREQISAMNQNMRDDRAGHCKDAIAKFRECEGILRTTLEERGSDVPQQQILFADGAIQSLSLEALRRT